MGAESRQATYGCEDCERGEGCRWQVEVIGLEGFDGGTKQGRKQGRSEE